MYIDELSGGKFVRDLRIDSTNVRGELLGRLWESASKLYLKE